MSEAEHDTRAEDLVEALYAGLVRALPGDTSDTLAHRLVVAQGVLASALAQFVADTGADLDGLLDTCRDQVAEMAESCLTTVPLN